VKHFYGIAIYGGSVLFMTMGFVFTILGQDDKGLSNVSMGWALLAYAKARESLDLLKGGDTP